MSLAADVRKSGLVSETWRYSDMSVTVLRKWLTQIQNLDGDEEVMHLRHTMMLKIRQGTYSQILPSRYFVMEQYRPR